MDYILDFNFDKRKDMCTTDKAVAAIYFNLLEDCFVVHLIVSLILNLNV